MKNRFQIILVITFFLAISSCTKQNESEDKKRTDETVMADNSRNSLDWEGIYSGVLPCADCEGILTIVHLKKDLTYEIQTEYLDESDTVFKSNGSFTWNDAGSKINLNDMEHNVSPSKFQVGENMLISLDLEGNKITGELADHYILMKIYPGIAEKYWKLKEIYGKKVKPDTTFNKEPHIILKAERNRFNGNGGCNSFSGSYEIRKGNRITFSEVASTLMACPNMDIEKQLTTVLNSADNYTKCRYTNTKQSKNGTPGTF